MAAGRYTKDRERHIVAALFPLIAAYMGYQAGSPTADWRLHRLHLDVLLTLIAGGLLTLGAASFLILVRKTIPAIRNELRLHENEKAGGLILFALVLGTLSTLAVLVTFSTRGRTLLIQGIASAHNNVNKKIPLLTGIDDGTALRSVMVAAIIVGTITMVMWHHKPWDGRLIKSIHVPNVNPMKVISRVGRKSSKGSAASSKVRLDAKLIEALTLIDGGKPPEQVWAQLKAQYPEMSEVQLRSEVLQHAASPASA